MEWAVLEAERSWKTWTDVVRNETNGLYFSNEREYLQGDPRHKKFSLAFLSLLVKLN